MKIENVIQELKPHLRDYLRVKVGTEVDNKYFKCFVHDEDTPSMSFMPGTDDTVVHCFGCNTTHDLLSAASYIEKLPESGREWLTETLPTLCRRFKIECDISSLDPQTKALLKLKKFWSDLSNIVTGSIRSDTLEDFLAKRYLSPEYIQCINESFSVISNKLIKMGWEKEFVLEQLGVGDAKKLPILDSSFISFLIEDKYSNTIGLVSKNLKDSDPRYINSQDSLLYHKQESLLGLSTAIKSPRDILYIVEGPCDLLALHNIGITNAVALCGTHFSKQQVQLIKLSGFRGICFALDNDSAGNKATKKHIYELIESMVGLSISVLNDYPFKDINEACIAIKENQTDLTIDFLKTTTPLIDYLIELNRVKDASTDLIVKDILPFIAIEPTATKREYLSSILSEQVEISLLSILEDVDFIRKNKGQERSERIKTAVEKYAQSALLQPDNLSIVLAQHEQDLVGIEQEYKKTDIGASYQLSRFDALEEQVSNTDEDIAVFHMNKMRSFGNAFNNGCAWTQGVTMYIGGRPNSGKTLIGWEIAIDILLNDPTAIVITHLTDDTYYRILPRVKTLLATYLIESDDPDLSLGMASAPTVRLNTPAQHMVYDRAKEKMRALLNEGKLFILDNEDGPYLSILERQLRYIRSYDSTSKIFILADGAHNYRDFGHLDQNSKMKGIAESQMDLVIKYKACMLCTAEYRKNLTINPNLIKWPVDDDIADSRALTYRCQVVTHVYNDLNDRSQNASIFWQKTPKGKQLPRIIYYFGKNKLSDFKDELVFDIDPFTVSLRPIDIDQAKEEAEAHRIQQEMNNKNANSSY